MLASLVRVSRRVEQIHLVRVLSKEPLQVANSCLEKPLPRKPALTEARSFHTDRAPSISDSRGNSHRQATQNCEEQNSDANRRGIAPHRTALTIERRAAPPFSATNPMTASRAHKEATKKSAIATYLTASARFILSVFRRC